MTDLERERVGLLTMKDVITLGADQGGRLKRVASHPLFWLLFFLSQLNFLSLINKLNYLKMGKWQPKLSELLSEYIEFDSFNSSTPPRP